MQEYKPITLLDDEARVERPRFKVYNFEEGSENMRIRQGFERESEGPASVFAERDVVGARRRSPFEYKSVVVEDKKLSEQDLRSFEVRLRGRQERIRNQLLYP